MPEQRCPNHPEHPQDQCPTCNEDHWTNHALAYPFVVAAGWLICGGLGIVFFYAGAWSITVFLLIGMTAIHIGTSILHTWYKDGLEDV